MQGEGHNTNEKFRFKKVYITPIDITITYRPDRCFVYYNDYEAYVSISISNVSVVAGVDLDIFNVSKIITPTSDSFSALFTNSSSSSGSIDCNVRTTGMVQLGSIFSSEDTNIWGQAHAFLK